uniref:WW domain-containing protein n=1 Tax=Macrostomum lignano TaxID=282301 RepID=A0A1I8GQP5_9PLAT
CNVSRWLLCHECQTRELFNVRQQVRAHKNHIIINWSSPGDLKRARFAALEAAQRQEQLNIIERSRAPVSALSQTIQGVFQQPDEDFQHATDANFDLLAAALAAVEQQSDFFGSTAAPAADAGLPADGAGLPTTDAGLPADGAGLPTTDAGLPADGAGLPTTDAGLPADGAGLPTTDAGLPADGAGLPTTDAGLPADGAGLPTTDAGLPADSAGLPTADAGLPADDSTGFAAPSELDTAFFEDVDLEPVELANEEAEQQQMPPYRPVPVAGKNMEQARMMAEASLSDLLREFEPPTPPAAPEIQTGDIPVVEAMPPMPPSVCIQLVLPSRVEGEYFIDLGGGTRIRLRPSFTLALKTSAHEDVLQVHRFTPGAATETFEFLDFCKIAVQQCLEIRFDSSDNCSVKAQIKLNLRMVRVQASEAVKGEDKWMSTQLGLVVDIQEFDDWWRQQFTELERKVDVYNTNGSGWIIEKINFFELYSALVERVSYYTGHAAEFILPTPLLRKKAVICPPSNEDEASGHWCAVSSINRLLNSKAALHRRKWCERCLLPFHSDAAFEEHSRAPCQPGVINVKEELPDERNNILRFSSWEKTISPPFVVYADFEALNAPCQEDSIAGIATKKLTEHIAVAAGYIVLHREGMTGLAPRGADDKVSTFVSDDPNKCISDFLQSLEKLAREVYGWNTEFSRQAAIRTEMAGRQFREATACCYCRSEFTEGSNKHWDHDHLSGEFRGAACADCNMKARLKRSFLPVVFHNFKGYDLHLMMSSALGLMEGWKISVIPLNPEQFLSMKIEFKIGEYEKIHETTEDLPFAPEKAAPNFREFPEYMQQLWEKVGTENSTYHPTEKLMLTCHDKPSYVVHSSILAFYLNHGMRLDRPIFIGQCVLDFSKMIMYELFYDKLKPWIENDGGVIKLCGGDTDSFFLSISNMSVQSKVLPLLKSKQLLDTSNYPQEHALFSNDLKARLGCIKDEAAGARFEEWLLLRPKLYSFKASSQAAEKKKAKGVQGCIVKKELAHSDYLRVFNELCSHSVVVHRIASIHHRLYTLQQRKYRIILSSPLALGQQTLHRIMVHGSFHIVWAILGKQNIIAFPLRISHSSVEFRLNWLQILRIGSFFNQVIKYNQVIGSQCGLDTAGKSLLQVHAETAELRLAEVEALELEGAGMVMAIEGSVVHEDQHNELRQFAMAPPSRTRRQRIYRNELSRSVYSSADGWQSNSIGATEAFVCDSRCCRALKQHGTGTTNRRAGCIVRLDDAQPLLFFFFFFADRQSFLALMLDVLGLQLILTLRRLLSQLVALQPDDTPADHNEFIKAKLDCDAVPIDCRVHKLAFQLLQLLPLTDSKLSHRTARSNRGRYSRSIRMLLFTARCISSWVRVRLRTPCDRPFSILSEGEFLERDDKSQNSNIKPPTHLLDLHGWRGHEHHGLKRPLRSSLMDGHRQSTTAVSRSSSPSSSCNRGRDTASMSASRTPISSPWKSPYSRNSPAAMAFRMASLLAWAAPSRLLELLLTGLTSANLSGRRWHSHFFTVRRPMPGGPTSTRQVSGSGGHITTSSVLSHSLPNSSLTTGLPGLRILAHGDECLALLLELLRGDQLGLAGLANQPRLPVVRVLLVHHLQDVAADEAESQIPGGQQGVKVRPVLEAGSKVHGAVVRSHTFKGWSEDSEGHVARQLAKHSLKSFWRLQRLLIDLRDQVAHLRGMPLLRRRLRLLRRQADVADLLAARSRPRRVRSVAVDAPGDQGRGGGGGGRGVRRDAEAFVEKRLTGYATSGRTRLLTGSASPTASHGSSGSSGRQDEPLSSLRKITLDWRTALTGPTPLPLLSSLPELYSSKKSSGSSPSSGSYSPLATSAMLARKLDSFIEDSRLVSSETSGCECGLMASNDSRSASMDSMASATSSDRPATLALNWSLSRKVCSSVSRNSVRSHSSATASLETKSATNWRSASLPASRSRPSRIASNGLPSSSSLLSASDSAAAATAKASSGSALEELLADSAAAVATATATAASAAAAAGASASPPELDQPPELELRDKYTLENARKCLKYGQTLGFLGRVIRCIEVAPSSGGSDVPGCLSSNAPTAGRANRPTHPSSCAAGLTLQQRPRLQQQACPTTELPMMIDSGISEPDHDYESNMSSRSQDGNHNGNYGNQVILEEVIEDYQPTPEELAEYARSIGINVEEEPELMFLAREGLVAPLPPDWRPIQDRSAEDEAVYYFNFRTGQSSWEHPCDEHYRLLVIKERQRLATAAAAPGASPGRSGSQGGSGAQAEQAAAASSQPQTPATTARTPRSLAEHSAIKSTATASGASSNSRIAIGAGSRILLDIGNDSRQDDVVEEDSDASDREDDGEEAAGDNERGEKVRDANDGGSKKKLRLSNRLSLMRPQEYAAPAAEYEETETTDVAESLRLSNNTLRDIGRSSFDESSPRKPLTGRTPRTPRTPLRPPPRVDEELSSAAEQSLMRLGHRNQAELEDRKLQLLEDKESEVRRLRIQLAEAVEAERRALEAERNEKLARERQLSQAELERAEAAMRGAALKQKAELEDRLQAELAEAEAELKAKQEESLEQLRQDVQSIQADERQRLESEKERLLGKLRSELRTAEDRERKKLEQESARQLEAVKSRLAEQLKSEREQAERRHAERIEEQRRELQARYEAELEELSRELERQQREERRRREAELRGSQERMQALQGMERSLDDVLQERRRDLRERQERQLKQLEEQHAQRLEALRKEHAAKEEALRKELAAQVEAARAQLQAEVESEKRKQERENSARLEEEQRRGDRAAQEAESRRRSAEALAAEAAQAEEEAKRRRARIEAEMRALCGQRDQLAQAKAELQREVERLTSERSELRAPAAAGAVGLTNGNGRYFDVDADNDDEEADENGAAPRAPDEADEDEEETEEAGSGAGSRLDALARAKDFLRRQMAVRGYPGAAETAVEDVEKRRRLRGQRVRIRVDSVSGGTGGGCIAEATRRRRHRPVTMVSNGVSGEVADGGGSGGGFKSKSMPSLAAGATDSEDNNTSTNSSAEFSSSSSSSSLRGRRLLPRAIPTCASRATTSTGAKSAPRRPRPPRCGSCWTESRRCPMAWAAPWVTTSCSTSRATAAPPAAINKCQPAAASSASSSASSAAGWQQHGGQAGAAQGLAQQVRPHQRVAAQAAGRLPAANDKDGSVGRLQRSELKCRPGPSGYGVPKYTHCVTGCYWNRGSTGQLQHRNFRFISLMKPHPKGPLGGSWTPSVEQIIRTLGEFAAHTELKEKSRETRSVKRRETRSVKSRGDSIGEEQGDWIGEEQGDSIGEEQGDSIGEEKGDSIGESRDSSEKRRETQSEKSRETRSRRAGRLNRRREGRLNRRRAGRLDREKSRETQSEKRRETQSEKSRETQSEKRSGDFNRRRAGRLNRREQRLNRRRAGRLNRRREQGDSIGEEKGDSIGERRETQSEKSRETQSEKSRETQSEKSRETRSEKSRETQSEKSRETQSEKSRRLNRRREGRLEEENKTQIIQNCRCKALPPIMIGLTFLAVRCCQALGSSADDPDIASLVGEDGGEAAEAAEAAAAVEVIEDAAGSLGAEGGALHPDLRLDVPGAGDFASGDQLRSGRGGELAKASIFQI